MSYPKRNFLIGIVRHCYESTQPTPVGCPLPEFYLSRLDEESSALKIIIPPATNMPRASAELGPPKIPNAVMQMNQTAITAAGPVALRLIARLRINSMTVAY